MKVLVVNLDKNIFTPGSKSLERLKEYVAFCEKLSVIVLTRQKFEPIIENGLTIIATGSGCRLRYTFDALSLAKKIITGQGADLVMTQDPFDTGHIGWLIKRKFNLPWQCQIHTDFLSPYFARQSFLNRVRLSVGKFLIKRADGFRVVSQRIKRSLVTLGIPESKIFVLPIFTDTAKFTFTPIKTDLRKKYPQFDFIILMASRLSCEKNIGLALEAMVKVVRRHPKAGLIIVGEGKEKKSLKLKTHNLKLETSVIFEPWTSDLVSYYRSADLFLLTSNYEGWGMAVVEAMAVGCVVVMTDVGCAGELVQNGKTGLVVPLGDKGALAAALLKAVGETELRRELGQAALAAVKNLPAKEEYLADYKKSWEAVINSSFSNEKTQ